MRYIGRQFNHEISVNLFQDGTLVSLGSSFRIGPRPKRGGFVGELLFTFWVRFDGRPRDSPLMDESSRLSNARDPLEPDGWVSSFLVAFWGQALESDSPRGEKYPSK